MKRHVQVALRQQGANALVYSASLVRENKEYVMEVINFAPHTTGNMKNFAVMMKGGFATFSRFSLPYLRVTILWQFLDYFLLFI